MVEAPEDVNLRSFDAQIVVEDPTTNFDGFAVEVFDGSDFDPDDPRDIEELYDDAIDSVTDRMRPHHFEEGDVVGYVGFDTMPRRGYIVSLSLSEPGMELLANRTSDDDGNLTVTPEDGWTATTPWLAKQVEPGDLLDAVTGGQVVETRPEGIVYGWEEGGYYLLRLQGPTSDALIYRWDRDAEAIETKERDDNDYVFTTNLVAVYREPVDDPILGYVPETDTGLWSWDPFFVSDLPAGYNLDPYIPSQDGLSELIGEDIYARTSGVVYESTALQETPDGAGIVVETQPSLTYPYYTPTSSNSERSEVELVAVPADDPDNADTGSPSAVEAESPDTGRGSVDGVPVEELGEPVYETEVNRSEEQQIRMDNAVFWAAAARQFLNEEVVGAHGDWYVEVIGGQPVMVFSDDFPEGGVDVIETEMDNYGFPRPWNRKELEDETRIFLPASDDRTPGIGIEDYRDFVSGQFGWVRTFDGERVWPEEVLDDGTTDTGTEQEQEDMSGSSPAQSIQDLYDEAPFTREEAIATVEDIGFQNELEELDGIGPSRADTLREAGILLSPDLGMLVVGSGSDSAIPPEETTLPPLSDVLDEFRGRGRSSVLDAAADVRETVLDGMASSKSGSLPTGESVDPDRPDAPSFPVIANAVYVGPETGPTSALGEIEFENADLSRVNADAVESVRETLEMLYPPGEVDPQTVVAQVEFMDEDCYEIETGIDSLGLRDIEEYEGPVEVGRSRVPGGLPQFVAEGPDGTPYLAVDGKVYAYPSTMDATKEAISIDRQKGERLGLPAQAFRERVEATDGWEFTYQRPERVRDDSRADDPEPDRGPEPDTDPDPEPNSEANSEPNSEANSEADSGSFYRGMSPEAFIESLEMVLPKATVATDTINDQTVLSWVADEEHEGDFDRDSASVPLDPDDVGSVVTDLVGAYDSAVSLTEDESEELAQARSDSPFEIPNIVEADGADNGGEADSGQQDSGGAPGVDNPSPLPDKVIRRAQEILDNPRSALDGSPDKNEIGLAVADVLGDEFGMAVDGAIEVMIVEPIYDQVSDGQGGVTTELTRVKMGVTAPEDEPDRLAGSGFYNTSGPVTLEGIELASKVGFLVDGLVDIVRFHDRRNSEYRDLQSRIDELSEASENTIQNGNVDFQRLVLTAEQARMLGRTLPKFYEEQFLDALDKIDPSLKYAQLAVGAMDGSSAMQTLLDETEAGLKPGGPRDIAIQELRDRMGVGDFDPGQYIRDYYGVPVNARDPGDIVQETQQAREQARRDATMTDLEQQVGAQGPFTIEVVRKPGLNRRGLGARVVGHDSGILEGDTVAIEEVLFQTSLEIDADQYASGEVVAEAEVDGEDVTSLDINQPGGGSSRSTTDATTSTDTGGSDTGSTDTSPEEPRFTDTDPGGSVDTTGSESTSERSAGGAGGGAVGDLDPERVVVEELNIEKVETGDVDVSVTDPQAVADIRADIEDSMDDDV